MLSTSEQQEILRRRTFAIISHPDAGKTTLTEKLLLYGGAIHVAGAVKSNKIRKTATSDWMEIEKQRGISVATSVMGFDYKCQNATTSSLNQSDSEAVGQQSGLSAQRSDSKAVFHLSSFILQRLRYRLHQPVYIPRAERDNHRGLLLLRLLPHEIRQLVLGN